MGETLSVADPIKEQMLWDLIKEEVIPDDESRQAARKKLQLLDIRKAKTGKKKTETEQDVNIHTFSVEQEHSPSFASKKTGKENTSWRKIGNNIKIHTRPSSNQHEQVQAAQPALSSQDLLVNGEEVSIIYDESIVENANSNKISVDQELSKAIVKKKLTLHGGHLKTGKLSLDCKKCKKLINEEIEKSVCTDSGKTKYNCQKCSKIYVKDKPFTKHVIQHFLKEKPTFECPFGCGARYKQHAKIQRHVRLRHQRDVAKRTVEILKKKMDGKR